MWTGRENGQKLHWSKDGPGQAREENVFEAEYDTHLPEDTTLPLGHVRQKAGNPNKYCKKGTTKQKGV